MVRISDWSRYLVSLDISNLTILTLPCTLLQRPLSVHIFVTLVDTFYFCYKTKYFWEFSYSWFMRSWCWSETEQAPFINYCPFGGLFFWLCDIVSLLISLPAFWKISRLFSSWSLSLSHWQFTTLRLSHISTNHAKLGEPLGGKLNNGLNVSLEFTS